MTLVIQGKTGQTGVSGWALFAVPLVRGLGVGAAQINSVSLFFCSFLQPSVGTGTDCELMMTGGDAMQETGQLRGYLKTADVRAAIGGDGGGVQQSTCTRVAPRNKSNARNMRCRFWFL